MPNPILRQAVPEDAAAIWSIYAPYVGSTIISFELTVPTLEEFTKRVAAIAGRYPYVVLELDGKIAGFAYACLHMERAAYAYDVLTSIYVSPAAQGQGWGKSLYFCLFDLLAALGYYNAYAGITLPNEKSVGLHHAVGFKTIGVYEKTGYKFGAWHDVLLLGRFLQDFSKPPGTLQNIHDLDPKIWREANSRHCCQPKRN